MGRGLAARSDFVNYHEIDLMNVTINSDPDWPSYRYECESCGERSDSDEACPSCQGIMRKRSNPDVRCGVSDKIDASMLEARTCDNCSTPLVTGRHNAPCGAVCGMGCAIGRPAGVSPNEKTHDRPWEGPPETDGHYHGECPNGCFKDCCKPVGNLCGPKCQQCFGCPVCGYVHAAETPHIGSGY